MTSDSGAPDQAPDPHDGEPQGGDPQGGDPQGGDPQASDPQAGAVPPRRRSRGRNSAWLYIILGLVIGAVGVVGLFSDDSGILDWLLILLGVINLAIGIKVLTVPDEPFHGNPEDQAG